ncbi:MAG: UDP-3-O-(3-hydroxymyristoyl)glucosamine N-acyltransferase [Gemmatimonadota bacterium]|jgi:UDP-3-O-[3-hydroxymyristoyl] glucosamine N-acyltransferase|nr:UDP-3-O-(3-hydroxymyristoyl)glucosamine N-acyltransferase [Gemmatimonadota bacterium]
MERLTVAAIAELVGGTVRGDSEREITGVASLDRASPGELSFIARARYLSYLHDTRAGAVLVTGEWVKDLPETSAGIVVKDPQSAMQQVLTCFYKPAPATPGIHPTAIVPASVKVGDGVSIAPYVVLGEDAEIGDRVVIGSHSVIGSRCTIGNDVVIHPHVTVYDEVILGDRVILHSGVRVGKEGFGYVWKDGGHRKVPQVGGCVIESDVEIGGNSSIDRGSVGDTVVKAGAKIDSLVHLGHNVQLGRHSITVAQVGVAGSTVVGDGVVLGGQAGLGGHLQIGAGARVGGQAGVTGDIAPGVTVSGYPARPHREALRAQAAFFRLPEFIRRLKRLESAIFGESAED